MAVDEMVGARYRDADGVKRAWQNTYLMLFDTSTGNNTKSPYFSPKTTP